MTNIYSNHEEATCNHDVQMWSMLLWICGLLCNSTLCLWLEWNVLGGFVFVMCYKFVFWNVFPIHCVMNLCVGICSQSIVLWICDHVVFWMSYEFVTMMCEYVMNMWPAVILPSCWNIVCQQVDYGDHQCLNWLFLKSYRKK